MLELVDANGVLQGIQKVKVGPATRSVVATRLHYIILLCGIIFLLPGL